VAKGAPQLSHEAAGGRHGPNTWADFEAPLDYYRRRDLDGIGFVSVAGDGFCGIDLDECREPRTEEVDAAALGVVRA
jgi:primase-polymerase (primpol)-like protein